MNKIVINSRKKKQIAFVLIAALVLTAIIPVMSFAGDDIERAAFKFLLKDGSALTEYYQAETDDLDVGTLSSATTEEGSVFDVDALNAAYSSKGEDPAAWYLDEDATTTYSAADLGSQTVAFGSTMLFKPIYAEDKTEPKAQEDNSDSKTEDTTVFNVQLFVNGSQYDDDIEVLSGSSIDAAKLGAPNVDKPEGAVAFQGWYEDLDDKEAFDENTRITKDIKLYAKYRYQYVILFKSGISGVGDGLVTDYEYYTPGTQQIIKPPTIKPIPGYNFLYWYDEDDNEKTPVSFNASLVPKSDKTYVARYSNTVNVVFVSDGTQIDNNIQAVKIGGKANNPNQDPTRTGYDFAGWAKKRNADQSEFIDFGQDTFSEDTVLYAQWNTKKVSYTIVYQFEKPDIVGAPGKNENNYRYDHHTVVAPTGNNRNDTKNGVAYAGDTIDVVKNADGIYINGVKREDAAVPYGEFDHFEKNSYEVAGNGSTVINVYFKRSVYEYRFDLFNDIRNTYNGYAENESKYRNITGVAVMTAPILDSNGQVQRDTNNKIMTKEYTQSYDQGDCGYVLNLKYQQNIDDLFPSWANADFTRTGSYEEKSNNGRWSTKSLAATNFASWDQIGEKESGSYVSKRIILIDQMIPIGKNSHTVTSDWTSNPLNNRTVGYYFEVFDDEKADYDAVTDKNKLPANIIYTRSGSLGKYVYTYYKKSDLYSQSYKSTGTLVAKEIEGMSKVSETIYKNSTVKDNESFAYLRAKNNLNFNAMGGSVSVKEDTPEIYKNKFSAASGNTLANYKNIQYQDVLGKYVNNVSATRHEDGITYKFEGWYYDSACQNQFESKDTMPNSGNGLTLYAKWSKTGVTVSYYDGFPNEKPELITTAATGMNSPLESDPPYEKGGFDEKYGVFLGWYYELTLNGVKQYIEFDQSMHITADMDLYAKWDATGYTIDYLKGEGNILVPVDNNTYVSGIPVRVKAPTGEAVDAASKIFIGWKADILGNELPGMYYPGSLYTIKGPTSMTAIYGDPSDFIRLTYHSNYPDSNVKEDIYKHNVERNSTQKALDANAFTMENQKIIGWSTIPSGKVEIKLGEEFRVGTADMDLYAVWAIRGYSVTFNTDPEGVLFKGSEQQTGKIEYKEIDPGTEFGTVSDGAVTAKPSPSYSSTHYFAGWVDDYDTQNIGNYVDLLADNVLINKNYSYTAKYLPKEKITIKADDATKVYDGSALTEDGWKITSGTTGALRVEVEMTADSTITNAGDIKNKIDSVKIYDKGKDVTYKYDITKLRGDLKVTKRSLTITATSASFYYDESEHSADDYTVSGLVTGHEITSGVKIDGKITYPGSTTNKAIDIGIVIQDNGKGSDLAANYDIKTADGILTVTIDKDNPMTIKIIGDKGKKVYNGYQQSVSGITVKGKADTDYTVTGLTTDTALGTNVSTYAMNLVTTSAFKIEVDGHDVTSAYSVAIEDGQLDITKRPLKITADSHNFLLSDIGKNNVWHEFSYQKESGNEGLVSGHAITNVAFSAGSYISSPGTEVDNVITSAGILSAANNNVAGNYEIDFVDGKLAMTDMGDWILDVRGQTASEVYDATEKTVDGFTSNLDMYAGDETFASIELEFTNNANAVKGTDAGIYIQDLEAAIESGNFKIMAKKTANSDAEDITDYFDLSKTTATNGSLEITKAIVTFSAIGQTIVAGSDFDIPSFTAVGFPKAATNAEKESIYKRNALIESGYLSMKVGDGTLAQYSGLDTSDPATYSVSWNTGNEEPSNYNVITENASLKVLPFGKVKYDANVTSPGTYKGNVPTDSKKYWNDPDDDTALEITVMDQNTLDRAGYRFIGWEYDGNKVGDTLVFPQGVLDDDSDHVVTLYAIWERDLSFSLVPYDGYYDGDGHTIGINGIVAGDMITYEVTDANGNILTGDTFQFTGQNKIKEFIDTNMVETETSGSINYDVTVTADDENTSDQKASTLNIRPVPLSLQPLYAEKNYDGKVLKATQYSMLGNLVKDEAINDDAIVFEGAITEAGITTSGIATDSLNLAKGRDIDNYDITLLNNLLKINAVQGQMEDPVIDPPVDPNVLGEKADPDQDPGYVMGEEAKTSDSMNLVLIIFLLLAALAVAGGIFAQRKPNGDK